MHKKYALQFIEPKEISAVIRSVYKIVLQRKMTGMLIENAVALNNYSYCKLGNSFSLETMPTNAKHLIKLEEFMQWVSKKI